MKEALRGADTDNSNTINKQELRGLLEQFCFSMDDKQFEQVSSRFFVGGSDEVSCAFNGRVLDSIQQHRSTCS